MLKVGMSPSRGLKPESGMSKTYWADLDKDVVENIRRSCCLRTTKYSRLCRYKSKSSTLDHQSRCSPQNTCCVSAIRTQPVSSRLAG